MSALQMVFGVSRVEIIRNSKISAPLRHDLVVALVADNLSCLRNKKFAIWWPLMEQR